MLRASAQPNSGTDLLIVSDEPTVTMLAVRVQGALTGNLAPPIMGQKLHAKWGQNRRRNVLGAGGVVVTAAASDLPDCVWKKRPGTG